MINRIPIGQFKDHDFDLRLRDKAGVTAQEMVAEYAKEAGVVLDTTLTEAEQLESLLSTLVRDVRAHDTLISCFALESVCIDDAAEPAIRDDWQPSAEVEEKTQQVLPAFTEAVDMYRNQLLDANWQGRCSIDDMSRFVVGAMLIGENQDE
jgi:hypothetical protein